MLGRSILAGHTGPFAPQVAIPAAGGPGTAMSGPHGEAALRARYDAALATAYADYSGAIHSYAYHLLGNQEDADDVTQEVFIRAHGNLPRLREPARLRAWLFRVATNLCMDYLRRRSRLHRALGTLLSLGAPAEAGDEQSIPYDVAQSPANALLDGVAERDHIASTLRRLPPSYAGCLLLHSAQGFSYREIADVLGISPGAAAVRLSRARDLFARCYEEGGAEAAPPRASAERTVHRERTAQRERRR